MEIATGGDWDGPWSDAFQYGLVTIKGVSYPFDPPSSYTGKYWSIYLNGYAAPSGICGFESPAGRRARRRRDQRLRPQRAART